MINLDFQGALNNYHELIRIDGILDAGEYSSPIRRFIRNGEIVWLPGSSDVVEPSG